MRVLMILGSLDVGGAEIMAVELAAGLRREGVEVCAAALRGGEALAEEFALRSVPLEPGLLRFRYDALGAWRVARRIRRGGFDTVMIVDIYRNAMFCGLWGARLSGRPVRTILWASAVPIGQAGDFTPRVRRALRRGLLDEIVCVSDWQRRMLIDYDLPSDRMATIHNGVDVEAIASAEAAKLGLDFRGREVLLHVANVMPDKDFSTLLEAARSLRVTETPFTLLLAGRGTDSPAMLRKIGDLGLGGWVIPLGLRRDVPALLAASDALVLSTRSEVFSVAVLEAMAAGRAIVASDVPSFSEMFTNGVEGLRVEPGDSDALTVALRRVLSDPALRAGMGRAGRRRAAEFSRDAMCGEFLALLRRPHGGEGSAAKVH